MSKKNVGAEEAVNDGGVAEAEAKARVEVEEILANSGLSEEAQADTLSRFGAKP